MSDNYICKKHSGVEKTLEDHDRNIAQLWQKWDGMQKLLIGSAVALILNLICVIAVLIRMM